MVGFGLKGLGMSRRSRRFPLSLKERAGVRGKETGPAAGRVSFSTRLVRSLALPC
jgi:hypothetical protein